MTWQEMLNKAIWMVFAAAFVIYVGGCTATESGRVLGGPDDERIEIIRKGEPAPDDGFWLSRRTFLMLYEAAEKSVASPGPASQQNARDPLQPSGPADPFGGDRPPEAKGTPE